MLKSSKIYVGKVIHRRFKPKNHYFKYRVFSLLIDLDDLNEIDNKIKLFSYNKFNIISFFDKDHGDRDGTSLKNWVKKKLENIEQAAFSPCRIRVQRTSSQPSAGWLSRQQT